MCKGLRQILYFAFTGHQKKKDKNIFRFDFISKVSTTRWWSQAARRLQINIVLDLHAFTHLGLWHHFTASQCAHLIFSRFPTVWLNFEPGLFNAEFGITGNVGVWDRPIPLLAMGAYYFQLTHVAYLLAFPSYLSGSWSVFLVRQSDPDTIGTITALESRFIVSSSGKNC